MRLSAAAVGFGGLALVALLGAASSGFSGAAVMSGAYTLVVALVALFRGRVKWAHLQTRTASTGIIFVALVVIALGSALAPDLPTDGQHPASATVKPRSAPGHRARASTPTPKPPAAHRAAPVVPTSTPAAKPVTKAEHRRTERSHSRQVRGLLINTAGVILPNRHRTPGATNPTVTQSTIGSTICVPGWTSTIRPSSSVTTRLKQQQLASGYAYRGDTSTSDYEEDHLISLELGGSPSSPANLWPEPYATSQGARRKDVIENKLHALVCSRTISLAAAQHAIATNWWAAYLKYGGSAAGYSGVHHSTAPAPKPHRKAAPAPAPGGGATAKCNDGTFSYAAHHQGACSQHGGVEVFYK